MQFRITQQESVWQETNPSIKKILLNKN